MATIDLGKSGALHGAHGDAHEHHGSYLEGKGGFWATIWDWATTVDHKKIGMMYLVAVLFMFFLGGVASLGVRLELFQPTAVDATGKITGNLLGQLFGAGDSLADSNLF